MKEGAEPLTLDKIKGERVDWHTYNFMNVTDTLDESGYINLGHGLIPPYTPNEPFINVFDNRYIGVWVNHDYLMYYTINKVKD